MRALGERGLRNFSSVVERAPPHDEISGITERSVPKRPARPDGEIPGVTGKSEDERANPDENLGWERSVSRMCVDHYGSVEGEMSVKFCIGSPANVGVMAGRPEEFFIGTPTPGDPETPPRAALEDHWVMRCIGKPADETMGESDLRGLADHLGDIRLRIKAPVDESFVRGRPEEFFIGTPTPGTLRTPSIWQGAGETLTCDSLHGVRDSGCEMQLSSMSAEVGPVSSVFELLYRFVGIDPDSITTEQFLGPYACGGQSSCPQTFPRTLGDCLEGRPLLGHDMRDLDDDSGEVRMGMHYQADAYAGECILHVQDVPRLRGISQESSHTRQPHPNTSSVLGAWAPGGRGSWCDESGHLMSRDLSCEDACRVSGDSEARIEICGSRQVHGNLMPRTFKSRSGVHGQLVSHGSTEHEQFRSTAMRIRADEIRIHHRCPEDCWGDHDRKYEDEMRVKK